MSEFTETITLCDKCHGDKLPTFVMFMPVENIQGVHRGSFETATHWREVDYGHICPECAAEEDELNSSGEMILGAEALAPLVEDMVAGPDSFGGDEYGGD